MTGNIENNKEEKKEKTEANFTQSEKAKKVGHFQYFSCLL